MLFSGGQYGGHTWRDSSYTTHLLVDQGHLFWLLVIGGVILWLVYRSSKAPKPELGATRLDAVPRAIVRRKPITTGNEGRIEQ